MEYTITNQNAQSKRKYAKKKNPLKVQITIMLALKGLATIILYWKFSHEVGLIILVISCSMGFIFVKLQQLESRDEENRRYIENELLSLLLLIAPLSLSGIEEWKGSFSDLIFHDGGIKYYIIDG